MPQHVAQQFWAFGPLRCVLLFDTATAVLYVQIVSGHTALCSQRVGDPDEAATAAEELWKEFVEKPA